MAGSMRAMAAVVVGIDRNAVLCQLQGQRLVTGGMFAHAVADQQYGAYRLVAAAASCSHQCGDHRPPAG
jgi:hypothetical protein